MIFALNNLQNLWAEVMLRATVHGAIAVGIVFVIGFLFSKYLTNKAQCWLWRLVFVKLLLLAVVTTPFKIPILPVSQVSSSIENGSDVNQVSPEHLLLSKSPWLAHDPVSGKTIGFDDPSDIAPDSLTNGLNESSAVRLTQHAGSTESSHPSTWFFSFEYPTLLFTLWLTGVVVFLGWLSRTWLVARRLYKSCVPLNDPQVHRHCHDLCHHFGIKSKPDLSVSRVACSPLLVGNFSPRIVFPADTLENLDDDQLRLVIAHELSHLKRRDLWWSWLPTVVQILFFFHPFVWAAKTRWLLSREMACDELVLSVTGKSATSYADALINVSRCMGQPDSGQIANTAFGSTCMVQTSFTLKRRIQAMKNFTNHTSISLHTAIAFGLTALLVVVPWQPVQRQLVAVAPSVTAPVSTAAIPGSVDVNNLNFEETNANGFPVGWGGGGKGYELTSSPDAHRGESCGQIQSVVDADQLNFGSFTKGIMLSIADYRGKRLRFSGYLKSDIEADAWAGLWMRVDGESTSVSFDNMNNRPVKGKTDWTEYSVVLDVPEEATNINYGFLLAGAGTLWGDDLEIEVVGNIGEGPAVTDMKKVNAARKGEMNLNFEDIRANGMPARWGGGGQGYELTASPDAHRGESCGKIESTGAAEDLVFGTFTNRLDVEKYLGKRVRYSGYLRSKMKADAWAGIWMRVDQKSKSVAFDNMQQRPVKGNTDWTQYSIVLDVPQEATNINFGFLISGQGTLWGDDLKFEIVGDIGEGPDVTDMKRAGRLQSQLRKETPTNLNFEDGADKRQFTGWFGGGKGFSVEMDNENARTGKGCVRMERIDANGRFSGMSQRISAKPYLGKKILLTGYIQTEETDGGGAGLWMRIDGTNRNTVGFDNMDSRPILGTTDWTQYEIEMDVPDNSVYITFGVLLKGGGIAWADDFAIESIE